MAKFFHKKWGLPFYLSHTKICVILSRPLLPAKPPICSTYRQACPLRESKRRSIRDILNIFIRSAACGIRQKQENNMKTFINESSENYLETILLLSKKLPVVRAVDIANELDFKKPSVSIAMKNLREKNQITVSEQGFIYLTESGKEIAEMIYERHLLISAWLEKLGVPAEIAAEDACRIEHVISKESFEAVKNYVNTRD